MKSKIKKVVSVLAISISMISSVVAKTASVSTVIEAGEVKWGYLNPLRGNKSPGAANLWGDRTKDTATGMLVRFNKGFSSPPHIHNISYRGVVIAGAMHNDDPTAEKMWMYPGSFWTQPAGENHITAADGSTNLIYLEIDSGPYLVKPSEESFNNGELPINLASSNMVWISDEKSGVQTSYLWGGTKPESLGGRLLKLPKGFKGAINSEGKEFKAVVIDGTLAYQSTELNKEKVLSTGSYFSSTGNFSHEIATQDEITLYIRSDNLFRFDM